MITHKFGENIVCFYAKTQKELTLTFFRVQEFYESQKPNIFRKEFDAYTFLDEYMDKNGNINYFSEWDGFNVPSYIFTAWMASTVYQRRSEYEEAMINHVYKHIDPNKKYYVIGVRQGDKSTLKHELSHAYYYTNENYKTEADNLLHVFKSTYPKQYKLIMKALKSLGYSEQVLDDEFVAWIATSSTSELMDVDMYFPETETLIKRFRKLLRKYNTVV